MTASSGSCVPTAFTNAELYERGVATMIASWEAYAHGALEAVVHRAPGVVCGIFPHGPERGVYNNALLSRHLGPTERTGALDAMAAAYATAGVGHYAAWVHEEDEALRVELERRGYVFDSATRAMGMALHDIRLPRPTIELGPVDWGAYLRLFDLPRDLLRGADLSAFHLAMARLGGEDVAAALAYDHDGDCGIFNVSTVERARRRGLATALTCLQLHDALARGCQTASLQATPMAEHVYTTLGFRDLGRFLEYVPVHPSTPRLA
jgi:hypothetical protein